MATLKYWIAECVNDAECYSIIGKTKKEVWEKILTGESAAKFSPPVQKTIEYRDAFDLFDWCTGEGGGRACGINVK